MAYLRIHCDVCGGEWEIYHRDDFKADKARQCPHCFSEIDRQTWANQVLPAFGLVHDANAELYKDHAGYHKPLFSFDVIADHLYKNRDDEDELDIDLDVDLNIDFDDIQVTDPTEIDLDTDYLLSLFKSKDEIKPN